MTEENGGLTVAATKFALSAGWDGFINNNYLLTLYMIIWTLYLNLTKSYGFKEPASHRAHGHAKQ